MAQGLIVLLAIATPSMPAAGAPTPAVAETPATQQQPIECTDGATQPNWPTFHVINAVSRDPESGVLSAEHLNDVSESRHICSS